MFLKKLLVLGVIASSMFGAAFAQAGDKESAVKLIDEAVAFHGAQGKDKTIAEVNKQGGKFDKGELYVFAYDLNGAMLAHPKNPKLVGQNLLEVPDANGKLFRKDIINGAKNKGSGWVDYMYKNPKSGEVEAKTTYFKKTGDMVFCAGVYK